ncbi:hypothetical protein MPER_04416, partial [Moniliophthora perniciosa FA553]
NVQTVSYAAPAATTAVATFLIGIKVWDYLRTSKVRAVEDKLAQVILTIPAVKDAINLRPNLRFATTVYSYQTSSIVGMYPTIIICSESLRL